MTASTVAASADRSERRSRGSRCFGRRGNDAARADAARRRLQADDVVEAGRHAARSRRVGAEREGHVAARHGDGRARARAAADAIGRRRCAGSAGRTASACRRGRWRTGRGWSCRCTPHRPRSVARPRSRASRRRSGTRGTRPSSAIRRRRCCPSPRTARRKSGIAARASGDRAARALDRRRPAPRRRRDRRARSTRRAGSRPQGDVADRRAAPAATCRSHRATRSRRSSRAGRDERRSGQGPDRPCKGVCARWYTNVCTCRNHAHGPGGPSWGVATFTAILAAP